MLIRIARIFCHIYAKSVRDEQNPEQKELLICRIIRARYAIASVILSGLDAV